MGKQCKNLFTAVALYFIYDDWVAGVAIGESPVLVLGRRGFADPLHVSARQHYTT